MKAIFLLILSSVMFVCVGEAQEVPPTETPELLPSVICNRYNFRDYIYRETTDESEPVNCQLSVADLSNEVFPDANFSHVVCYKTNFSYTNLRDANFFYANCIEADFSYADVRGVNFEWANLRDAIFTNTIVTPEQANYLSRGGISGFIVQDVSLSDSYYHGL